MSVLDEWVLTNAEKYDFRDLTVHSNKVVDKEIVYIKDKDGWIVKTIVLNKE